MKCLVTKVRRHVLKMASLQKIPRKGILKTSSSFDQAEQARNSKEMKWDEMNILATHHPPGKDYGHMKIDEPPTPYSKYSDQEDEGDSEISRRGSFGEKADIDPASIASRLEDMEGSRVRRVSTTDDSSEEEEEEDLTDDQKVQKKDFEQKRKLHYNEFQAVKLAKQLMAEEDEDEEEEEETRPEQEDSEEFKDCVSSMQTDETESTDCGGSDYSGSMQDTLAEQTGGSSGKRETVIN